MFTRALTCGFATLALIGLMPDDPIETPHAQHSAVAAPSLIVFHGPALDRRVLMKEWRENVLFMKALSPRDDGDGQSIGTLLLGRIPVPLDTAARPSVDVALFWGHSTARLKRTGQLMEQWPVAEADQHARFYPATRDKVALWIYVDQTTGTASGAKWPSDDALAMLAKYGVPTTIG